MHLDGAIPGLYLRVAPGGSKSFILRTMVRGKRTDIGLGGFPTVSLVEARDAARDLRSLARKGGDPLAERRKSDIPLFKVAAERVHREQIIPSTKNGKHQDQWINTLRQHANPVIGGMGVDRISSADVLQVLSKVWIEKPETARRIKQRMKTVFAWARQAGFREAGNPVDDVATALPRQRQKAQHYSALSWKDVPEFWTQLQGQESLSAKALSFLIVNAARTGEVVGAKWDEIDFENKVWTVPASRMKTGIEHRKPLSDTAINTLENLNTKKNVYIFPSQKPDKPISNMAMLALLRRMQRDDITVHGFRTSFRTRPAEQTDVPREIAEMCLAHDIRGNVEQAYARTDYFERRPALMAKWSDWCTGAEPTSALVN